MRGVFISAAAGAESCRWLIFDAVAMNVTQLGRWYMIPVGVQVLGWGLGWERCGPCRVGCRASCAGFPQS